LRRASHQRDLPQLRTVIGTPPLTRMSVLTNHTNYSTVQGHLPVNMVGMLLGRPLLLLYLSVNLSRTIIAVALSRFGKLAVVLWVFAHPRDTMRRVGLSRTIIHHIPVALSRFGRLAMVSRVFVRPGDTMWGEVRIRPEGMFRTTWIAPTVPTTRATHTMPTIRTARTMPTIRTVIVPTPSRLALDSTAWI
jgi:hypothetical protein